MFRNELDLLRSARAETLEMSARLSQNQADFAPAPGKWSAGEVLDHLLVAEKLSRGLISQLIDLEMGGKRPVISLGFREVNTSVAFIPRSLLPFLDVPFTVLNLFVPPFVREAMMQFRIVPAQNPDIAVPRRGVSIAKLREALDSSCRQTAELLRANPSIDYRRLRYQHPLLGDNNVLNILRIVALHERRHQSQLRDILNARWFPKAA